MAQVWLIFKLGMGIVTLRVSANVRANARLHVQLSLGWRQGRASGGEDACILIKKKLCYIGMECLKVRAWVSRLRSHY